MSVTRHRRGVRRFGTLVTPLPVYITRHSADQTTATYSVPVWLAFLCLYLITANVVVWSGIGLYEAVKVVFG